MGRRIFLGALMFAPQSAIWGRPPGLLSCSGDMTHPVLLYDGVCGLCNGLVRFLIRRDRGDRLRYAPLQSRFARELLERHGRDPDELNTVILALDQGTPDEVLVDRARAILTVMRWIGWPWKALLVFWPLPDFLLNFGYRIIARARYRLFGRHESCPIPSPEERERFLGFQVGEGSEVVLEQAADLSAPADDPAG